MKKLILLIMALLAATFSFAKSVDEKLGAMLNGGRWFELREFLETNTDTINPFLDLYAKAMEAHFFNQHEVAAEHCSNLLNSPHIDLANVASVGLLMCSDISMLGDNAAAAKTLEAINDAVNPYYEHLDSTVVKAIKTDIAKYKALAPYKINYVEPFGDKAIVPFDLVAVGADSTVQEAINVGGRINGHGCAMTFDTGAGVNVISDSLAAAFGLDILNVDLKVGGYGVQRARLAVAKELTVGGLTMRNVPFYVMTMLSGNDEADKYMRHFQIVIGRSVMEAVKYFTIDFVGREIVLRRESDIPPAVRPNLCISTGGVYRLLCHTFDGTPMIVNPDTGDSSYGTLNPNMLPLAGSRQTLKLSPKKIRMAGAGGVLESPYYEVKDMPLTIGGVAVNVPQMTLLVNETALSSEFDGRMGLAAFMLFRSVSFDLSRMVMRPSR